MRLIVRRGTEIIAHVRVRHPFVWRTYARSATAYAQPRSAALGYARLRSATLGYARLELLRSLSLRYARLARLRSPTLAYARLRSPTHGYLHHIHSASSALRSAASVDAVHLSVELTTNQVGTNYTILLTNP